MKSIGCFPRVDTLNFSSSVQHHKVLKGSFLTPREMTKLHLSSSCNSTLQTENQRKGAVCRWGAVRGSVVGSNILFPTRPDARWWTWEHTVEANWPRASRYFSLVSYLLYSQGKTTIYLCLPKLRAPYCFRLIYI